MSSAWAWIAIVIGYSSMSIVEIAKEPLDSVVNCFFYVIEYPKQGSLDAVALFIAGSSRREQVIGFEVV